MTWLIASGVFVLDEPVEPGAADGARGCLDRAAQQVELGAWSDNLALTALDKPLRRGVA